VDLWPFVVDQLAAAWGHDAAALRRRLANHYAGLPRERVARPPGGVLIAHGNDFPVPNGLEVVRKRFRLARKGLGPSTTTTNACSPTTSTRCAMLLGLTLV
jgi:hypothetical protein